MPPLLPYARLLFLSALLTLIACGERDTDMPPGADMSGRRASGMDARLPDMSAPDLSLPQDMPPVLITLPPKPWDPTQRGPYKVGFERSSFTYTSKPHDTERQIDYVFWYPTLRAEGLRVSYADNFLRQPPGTQLRPPLAPTLPADPPTRPFLVFSHGNASFPEQSFYLTEFLASHGWIVIAPSHKGNTLLDNEGAINFKSAIPRPQDVIALMDTLHTLPKDHTLAGHLDLQRAGISGHSFGGYTTLALLGTEFRIAALQQACQDNTVKRRSMCDILTPDHVAYLQTPDVFTDPRFKVAIAQTPASGLLFGQNTSSITTPTLFMSASRDKTLPEPEDGDILWAGMRGPHARFTLPQAGHFTYTNLCPLLGDSIKEIQEDGCGKDFPPPAQSHALINHYALAWLEYHLKQNMTFEPLVLGTLTPYDPTLLTYTRAPEAQ